MYPEATESLNRWYFIVKKTDFGTFQDVKNLFPSADQVKNFAVFNIGGNNYRLIAYIQYRANRLYIRNILTHKEYDTDKWKEDEWFANTKK